MAHILPSGALCVKNGTRLFGLFGVGIGAELGGGGDPADGHQREPFLQDAGFHLGRQAHDPRGDVAASA